MKKLAYLQRLRSAIDWALGGEREAWSRTIASVTDSDGSYRVEDVEAARDRILTAVDENLPIWFDAMCDEVEDSSYVPELERSPDQIWQSMLFLNSGIFATKAARELLLPFLVTIPSTVPGKGPLYMSPNMDGWGVESASSPE